MTKKQHEQKAVIRKLLKRYPKTRGNDNELIYRYLKEMNEPTDYEYLRHFDTNIAESIRRARQKIQETDPLLKANPSTQRNRKSLEKKIREEMRGV